MAQVQGLKVAGRASSSYYKERNLPLADLGKALAVATVLEGSVRKQGEQVRISARLTRVSDNRQLWADSYDGDLQDVFALQERIARNIDVYKRQISASTSSCCRRAEMPHW